MADPVGEQWPHFAALVQSLDALDGRTVTVTAKPRDLTEEEADRIHEALLRKQRSGSLGLNE